jgi:NAD(P)-dependent dehydrogenase (short-subunit alcohol dehydrogenase family)
MHSARQKRTVLVTGGSRGIGAGIARMFGKRGWDVVLTYVSSKIAAEAVATEILDAGSQSYVLQCDTRKEADICAAFAALDDLGIRIDALVNNAGTTGPRTRLLELPGEVLRDVIDTNLVGVVLCSREAARRMARSRGGAGGVIVNISSTGTKLGNPNQWVHYAATKGAIDTLTNGLARELAVEGIRVAAVAPGLTLTDPAEEAQIWARLENMKGEIPMARPGSVDEIAEGVFWLCSDAASYCTGIVLPIAGGR